MRTVSYLCGKDMSHGENDAVGFGVSMYEGCCEIGGCEDKPIKMALNSSWRCVSVLFLGAEWGGGDLREMHQQQCVLSSRLTLVFAPQHLAFPTRAPVMRRTAVFYPTETRRNELYAVSGTWFCFLLLSHEIVLE